MDDYDVVDVFVDDYDVVDVFVDDYDVVVYDDVVVLSCCCRCCCKLFCVCFFLMIFWGRSFCYIENVNSTHYFLFEIQSTSSSLPTALF